MTQQDTLRVVDFSTHLSGPIASQLLMQLGATVIKIEKPQVGDGLRGLPPMVGGMGMYHVVLNAGARSLTIDHHSPYWREVVTACSRWADAVIVGGRVESMAGRALDFHSLHAVNPRLVYCAVTGYGDVGPWRSHPAHGLNTDVRAGLVPVVVTDGQPRPLRTHQSIGTPLAGVFAALGILGAIRQRDAEGGGRYVHVSMWEAAMWFNWRHTAAYANTGGPFHAYEDRGSRYAMYQTQDNRVVLVCPIERKSWTRFCDLLGLPETLQTRGDWAASGMEFGLGRDDERAAIGAAIAAQPLSFWTDSFTSGDIPFSPVLSVAEAMQTEQATALGLMGESLVNGTPYYVPRAPIRIGQDVASSRNTVAFGEPPPLGRDTEAVLLDLGLSADLLS